MMFGPDNNGMTYRCGAEEGGSGENKVAPKQSPAFGRTTSGLISPSTIPAREPAIDALRALALCTIVLAHSGVTGWLSNLRAFDVPCMAVISAMSFSLSRAAKCCSAGCIKDIWAYVLSRVRRLLVPTYCFFCVFFAVVALVQTLAGTDLPDFRRVTWSRVIEAFLLGGGLAWIMRVYVLLAVANPFIAKFSGVLRRHALYLGVAALCMPFQLLALHFAPPESASSLLGELYRGGFLYLTGYGSIALLGYRHGSLSRRLRFLVVGIIAAGLALFWSQNGFLPFQDFKYAPHPYYLAYGVATTFALYEAFSLPALHAVATNRFVVWVSRNSLWIFLWHLLSVELLADFGLPEPLGKSVAGRWAVNMGFGLLLTALQNAGRSAWQRHCAHRR